jgi:hypothetical protein
MRFGLPAASVAAAVIGIFAPVSFTQPAGPGVAAAECDTCCRQVGATCVVCGSEECVAHSGYYTGKTGSGGCDPEIT